MKKFQLLFSTCLALLGVTNSYSQNVDHFYGGIGGGLGKARIDNDRINSQLINSGFSSSSISNTSKDTSYRVFVGYQFNEYFAMEGGYFKLGEFGFKSVTVPAGVMNGNAYFDGQNFDLIGSLPINDRLSLIGRFGVDSVRARDTFSGGGAVVANNSAASVRDANYKGGIGFSFKFNQSVSLRGELESYRVNDAIGNKGVINVASVSMVFPFGKSPELQPKVIEKVVYLEAPAAVVSPPPPPQERIIYKEIPAAVVVPPLPEHLHVSFSSDVLFGFDRSNVSPEGKRELDKFYSELNGVEYDQITIEGHTDRIGPKAYNDKLSLQRAEAVRAYIVASGFVPINKITTVGKGSSEPVTGEGACMGLHSSVAAIACLEPDRRVDLDVTGIKLVAKK